MPRNQLHYCATDKEIYDLLMSGKQRITDAVLHTIARDRGIFFSPKESRETLVSSLSLLLYGHADLQRLLGQRESPGRAEKLTSLTLKAALSVEDIRQVCGDYRDNAPGDEKVTTHQEGTNKYVVKLGYSELDYSKTRLLQRRKREAEIEFLVGAGGTTIRMPATQKAKEVVASIKNALDVQKKAEIPTESIELTDLPTPEARTEFFTSLISGLNGFRLENVTSIRVDSSLAHHKNDGQGEFDEEDDTDSAEPVDQSTTEAAEEMLSVVENVALKGQSLLGSAEYQQLKAKGFYTTNIVWKSKQTESPSDILEFEAGFDEPREAKGFKYNVKGVYRYLNGRYTVSLRPLTKEEKAPLLTLLERTARQVLAQLRQSKALDTDKSESKDEA